MSNMLEVEAVTQHQHENCAAFARSKTCKSVRAVTAGSPFYTGSCKARLTSAFDVRMYSNDAVEGEVPVKLRETYLSRGCE